jgi:hypothetical protein
MRDVAHLLLADGPGKVHRLETRKGTNPVELAVFVIQARLGLGVELPEEGNE